MAKQKPGRRVVVTKEHKNGRNTEFKDKKSGQTMNRPEFVKKIKSGEYPDYHVRKMNGKDTPVSNPNR